MNGVSVLMPARNSADTIHRAITSALDQSGIEVEVLVCENGSRDDTAAVVQRLMDQDARVKLIQPRGVDGVGASLNAAAETATGYYFIELDADDTLQPNCLAIMADVLNNLPERVGFVYGGVQYRGDSDLLYIPPIFNRMALRRGNTILYPFMYRRQAWDMGCRYVDHLFVEGRWVSWQDWDMALQLVEFARYEGQALPNLPVLNYTYNRTAEGQSVGARHSAELQAAFRARWQKVGVNL